MENEFNFIHEKLPESDKELFFGPLSDDDSFITINDKTTLAEITVAAGIFPSKSQAKKNLTNTELTSGWSQLIIGKKKVKINVLNWFE